MIVDKNCVSFSYRSCDDNNTDMSVEVMGDDVDEVKLMRLLTAFLGAIGSRVTLNL